MAGFFIVTTEVAKKTIECSVSRVMALPNRPTLSPGNLCVLYAFAVTFSLYSMERVMGIDRPVRNTGRDALQCARRVCAMDGAHQPTSIRSRDVYGAGDGNRTHVKSLGSSRSTIELHPRRVAILPPCYCGHHKLSFYIESQISLKSSPPDGKGSSSLWAILCRRALTSRNGISSPVEGTCRDSAAMK